MVRYDANDEEKQNWKRCTVCQLLVKTLPISLITNLIGCIEIFNVELFRKTNGYSKYGDAMRGNWKTGISSIDNLRLGDQEMPFTLLIINQTTFFYVALYFWVNWIDFSFL